MPESRRAFGRRVGLSTTAVSKAVNTGRIKLNLDGSLPDDAEKEEARKRGFKKGVKYNYVDKPYLIKTFKDKLHLGDIADLVDDFNNILKNGVWSEVIKEEIPTQEEIDRVLDYLKNKNNS